MSNTEALWQEFFVAAQALGQRPGSVPDKGLGITHLGLHYHMRQLYRQLEASNSRVRSGPFRGMDLGGSGEHMSACTARLLGIYEFPLQATIEAAVARGYDTLINIGAGEGYYAIGMALRLPALQVIAADTSADMQNTCRSLAQLNGVDTRVHVQGALDANTLAAAIKGRILIICDIEGAEEDLLSPAAVPGLAQTDMIVELHDVYRPGLSARMAAAFNTTHDVRIIGAYDAAPNLNAFNGLPELDRVLLTYEGRGGPTPWGVFTHKA